ncbi:MAG: hypothetical protein KDA49_15355, partial [Rhodospirillaceae bacterium]|nr:hypothetical protein [Rhodospirillaceae bacterium]
DRVEAIARADASPAYDAAAVAALPAPVRRYFAFAFPEPPQRILLATMTMEGQFRRPLEEGFEPTSAEQIAAARTPAFAFSGTTHLPGGLWARFYDAFAEGEMAMRARLLSAITVVDEQETPELNRSSLRRWLLESPLYPQALQPGGPVRWQPIDDTHARATVSADGLSASLVATFRADGSLASFDAEEDGDLTTPYHGSGEHAERTDYRMVDGVMIPYGFVIARAAGGETYPFWDGRITAIGFTPAE